MPKKVELNLTEEKRKELEWHEKHNSKPYIRERASAILKVAGGMSVRAVALRGLSKPRMRNTVSAWIRRYRKKGVEGLPIESGRGRKPSFSP